MRCCCSAMCAFASLVLGLGLTTTACYVFLAILVRPRSRSSASTAWPSTCSSSTGACCRRSRRRLPSPPLPRPSSPAHGNENRDGSSIRIGNIIYFIPFFFMLNPALIMQGPNPYLEGLGLMALARRRYAVRLRRDSGLSGLCGRPPSRRRARWPLRVLLVIGGFVIATPGRGIMPLSQWRITSLGLRSLSRPS